MDTNERLSKLEEIVSEILIDTHKLNEEVHSIKEEVHGINKKLDGFQSGFNRFTELLFEKFDSFTIEMKSMREDQGDIRQALLQTQEEQKKYRELEERVLKIEQTIYSKGA